jgi:hypothetical protein
MLSRAAFASGEEIALTLGQCLCTASVYPASIISRYTCAFRIEYPQFLLPIKNTEPDRFCYHVMELFSYLPLSDTTQVRLVGFESNPTSENANSLSLSCRLLAYKIEDAPQFVALSYNWGPARHGDIDELMTHGNKIMLNGRVFEVTQNLKNALNSIRMRCLSTADSEPKLFWVDTICINQHDVKDRNAQVNIMGRIYSKAARVWIWLGLVHEINMERLLY